jgi:hypothetical protein
MFLKQAMAIHNTDPPSFEVQQFIHGELGPPIFKAYSNYVRLIAIHYLKKLIESANYLHIRDQRTNHIYIAGNESDNVLKSVPVGLNSTTQVTSKLTRA